LEIEVPALGRWNRVLGGNAEYNYDNEATKAQELQLTILNHLRSRCLAKSRAFRHGRDSERS
jgi:hypothetical protein